MRDGWTLTYHPHGPEWMPTLLYSVTAERDGHRVEFGSASIPGLRMDIRDLDDYPNVTLRNTKSAWGIRD